MPIELWWTSERLALAVRILGESRTVREACERFSSEAGRYVADTTLAHAFRRFGLKKPRFYMFDGPEVPITVDLSGLCGPPASPPAPSVLRVAPSSPTPADPVEAAQVKRAARDLKGELETLTELLRLEREKNAFYTALGRPRERLTIKPRERTSGVREMTALVLASDWHPEEEVSPIKVQGRNKFTLDIARLRIQRFFDGIVDLITHHRASGRIVIRDLVLALMGDLMTGHIHEDCKHLTKLFPIETILWLTPQLEAGIRYLLKELDLASIKIPCDVGNHGRCHDSATEILTRDGWKTYDRISVGDLVATYPLNDGRLEWQPLEDVYVKEYNGPMVAVKTRSADFMVTPHHRMVVRDIHGSGERIVLMQELLDKGTLGAGCFPKCPTGRAEEYTEVSDDELRLIGWIVTDGGYAATPGGKTNVRIYQSKEKGILQISELLDRMGIRFTTHTRLREMGVVCGRQLKSIRPDVTFILSQESVSRLLQLLPNKKILPSWMFALSKRQFDILLEALLDGDGHVREREGKSAERQLYGRAEILDQVQALAVANGIPARVREDNRGTFVLSLPASRFAYINDWADCVTVSSYTGVIWCGTVANGTLVTRRNGIPLVSGNTTEYRNIATGPETSYEYGMYVTLQRAFADDPRVEFDTSPSNDHYTQIYDFLLHTTHGDSLRYAGGVGGLTIPLLKAVSSWDSDIRADWHAIGHFHTALDVDKAIANGSMIGWGAYSKWIRARYNVRDLSQHFSLIDKGNGRCHSTSIWVASRKDELAFWSEEEKAMIRLNEREAA